MAYYDPSPLLSPDDSLIEPIEVLVKTPKKASQRFKTGSQCFIPPQAIELNVFLPENAGVLRLTLTVKLNNKIIVNLSGSPDTLREGHFNFPGYHHNPSGVDVPPPHHIHFPTTKYPKFSYTTSSYAYQVSGNTDYMNAMQMFCYNNNINIQGLNYPLQQRPTWTPKI